MRSHGVDRPFPSLSHPRQGSSRGRGRFNEGIRSPSPGASGGRGLEGGGESSISRATTCTVSVIIPAFNRARTIRRAVQSVLRQSFQDFEIIVADDGSTDETKGIIERLSSPKIRRVSHACNRGAAAARNTGMRAAQGKYLAFLDSDDEWLENKLAEQIALLEGLSPEWGISCSAFYLVTQDSREMVINTFPRDLSRHLLSTCDLSPGSTLMVRRECAERVGEIDERFERLEDWDWLLRLSAHYRLAYVKQPLARIYKDRVPPAGVTERATLRFLSKHDEAFRAHGPLYRRRILSRHFLRLAHFYYLERKAVEGSRYFMKALLANPIQNPLRCIGVIQSLVDALVGTSVTTRAILLKRRYLKR